MFWRFQPNFPSNIYRNSFLPIANHLHPSFYPSDLFLSNQASWPLYLNFSLISIPHHTSIHLNLNVMTTAHCHKYLSLSSLRRQLNTVRLVSWLSSLFKSIKKNISKRIKCAENHSHTSLSCYTHFGIDVIFHQLSLLLFTTVLVHVMVESERKFYFSINNFVFQYYTSAHWCGKCLLINDLLTEVRFVRRHSDRECVSVEFYLQCET